MNTLTSGTGQPLLMIHGFPFDHSMWQAQIDPLSSVCQVILPDLRGFGSSTLDINDDPAGVAMETYATDLASNLDELEITEPVILCGFSMGGYILWQFAKLFPDRIKALVLCDTRAVADSDAARSGRLELAKEVLRSGVGPVIEAMLPKLLATDTPTHRPEFVEQIVTMIRQASPAAIAAALRGMARRPDMTRELANFDWPALAIVGAEDAISPSQEMQAIAQSLPQGKFCKIDGAGHMSPLERPLEFNRALLEFVASLS